MIVSDNTISAENLGDFLKFFGKRSVEISKLLTENVLKNPGRVVDMKANIGSAAASKNPKAALPTLPEPIGFYHTGERLYLGKFV